MMPPAIAYIYICFLGADVAMIIIAGIRRYGNFPAFIAAFPIIMLALSPYLLGCWLHFCR